MEENYMDRNMKMSEGLAALRRAASSRDWNTCVELTGELLRHLDPWDAISLAIQQLALFLPSFERYHEGATWPRMRLDTLVSLVQQRDMSNQPQLPGIPELSQDYDTPGANNFVTALENLWEAFGTTRGSERWLELLKLAIAGAIMARLVEHWGRSHPSEWERQYQHWRNMETGVEEVISDAILLGKSFWADPHVGGLDTALWLTLATEIENVQDRN